MQRTKAERVEAIWETVARTPGIVPAQVARRLGIARSAVTRALPALDEAGLLLSEDERGGIWPWRRGGGR